MKVIDADALMTDICDSIDKMTEVGIPVDGEWLWAKLNHAIKHAPTIEPERKNGMFIGTEFDGYADGNPVYYEWICSECGCTFEDDEPTYNFCPNCGCKIER